MLDFLLSTTYLSCFSKRIVSQLVRIVLRLSVEKVQLDYSKMLLGTGHLTCKGGGYGFLFRSEFFFRTTQELEY
jgi:hypothetical protein